MPSEPIALVRNTLYMKDRDPVIRFVIVRINAPCMYVSFFTVYSLLLKAM